MTAPTREQVVRWAKEAEKMANAACKEMPGMEYRAAEAFALITLARADLEAELESLRKDAEPVAWGISVEGEMCDVFINRDACVMEFERRNKLYPETPRVMVNLAIAAAQKEK